MDSATLDLERMLANAGQATDLLKALANPHRLILLCHLSRDELCVGELRARIGISQSALSQHLARLRDDRLVATRREARTIYYRIARNEVRQIIALLYELYCDDSPGKNEHSEIGRLG
jgi:DNA-binding transcriptional ArsR family regulator